MPRCSGPSTISITPLPGECCGQMSSTTPTKCSIEGCERRAKYVKTGWCQTHYHRWRRTGDPLTVKHERGASGQDAPGWRGDEITYYGAHARVKSLRGSATKYTCASCGKPGDHWSYDHTDPNQRWQKFTWNGAEVNVAYSPDVDRYRPMCRGCHLREDRQRKGGWARKTHCVRGHEFTEANTYVRADGERNCRSCARDRMRDRRGRP